MNWAAARLGLADTGYGNPIGLDEAGNYSTPSDLARLSRIMLDRRIFRSVFDTETATLPSLDPPATIETRNTLLLGDPTVTGIKTGHTIGAGYVLVGSARRDGVELISAVLGAPSELDRDAESAELLDYGFSLYSQRRAFARGEALARPEVAHAEESLALVARRGVAVGARRDQELDVRVQAPDEVEGPVSRGERLGTALVLLDGRRVARVPLLASRRLEEASPLDKARSGIGSGWALAVVALFAILLGGLAIARSRRQRDGGPREEAQMSREQRRDLRERSRRDRREDRS
jgi:D-alanyl-D-alanine carboxypeptidase (penicillin-binding protein 5/6)